MTDKQVRLASTQCVPHSMPKEADPFGDAFSLDAARAWSRGRIDAHAAVLARAGEAGADIAVTGEDIAALSSAATYLDDPSIFRTLVPQTAAYSLEALGRVARTHQMHIVACFYEPDGDRVVNSAVLFGRTNNPFRSLLSAAIEGLKSLFYREGTPGYLALLAIAVIAINVGSLLLTRAVYLRREL